jgi:CDP-diacylglycerol--serine O-phosphatidyltransferase
MMDPIVPELEQESRRRQRRPLFRHSRVPVRMLVPNFFTLLGLCAGLTSIRMSIEGRWEWALAAVVFAAFLDGIDGRVARLLKASSRFGAELDSLADFVNFGVAPAILLFTWSVPPGMVEGKSFAWICLMSFALASALRLARFNVAADEEKPKWQGNYFTGMPTPAAAIVVLLPVYLAHLDLFQPGGSGLAKTVAVYALVIGFLMVSTIPTYSGKLLHERIGREYVLPIFVLVMGLVSLLVTYPYGTLTGFSIAYIASIPVSWIRFRRHMNATPAATPAAAAPVEPARPQGNVPEGGRVVEIRTNDKRPG